MQVKYKLLLIELHIMKSLQVGKVDVDRCMEVLAALDRLPLNAFLLRRNPNIILTLRKCRKFVGSEQIRRRADYIYNRFKSYFLVWNRSEVNQLVGINMSAFDTDQLEDTSAAMPCSSSQSDAKADPEANSVSFSVSATSLCSTDASNSTAEILLQDRKMMRDDYRPKDVYTNDQIDKSTVDGADDIIESSSPLRRDLDNDTDLPSLSFTIPVTADATMGDVISPLPSLVQLSKQALDSRDDRSSLRSTGEPVTSHIAANMFCDIDEQSDPVAELTEKKDELQTRIEQIIAEESMMCTSSATVTSAAGITTTEHDVPVTKCNS